MTIEDPNAATSVFHTLWSGLLSAFGLLIFWNGKNIVSTLKDKADIRDLDAHKADVDARFNQMQITINRLVDAQSFQHAQNTERLDKILSEVYRARHE